MVRVNLYLIKKNCEDLLSDLREKSTEYRSVNHSLLLILFLELKAWIDDSMIQMAAFNTIILHLH